MPSAPTANPTANRATFPRDAASHRYPRGLPSPRRLSSPSPSPVTSLRLRLARRPRRADALHAAVAHEARSSPCAADSSVPSSAAGAPLLSSRLLPPSTLAERKAVPLASPSPYPTRARRASLPHLKLGPLAPPVRHSTPPPARDPTARRFRHSIRNCSFAKVWIVGLGGFQIGIKPSRTSTTASARYVSARWVCVFDTDSDFLVCPLICMGIPHCSICSLYRQVLYFIVKLIARSDANLLEWSR